MKRTRLRRKSSREAVKEALDNLFRPWVLHRAGNRCEKCDKVNGAPMPRGHHMGRDPYVVLQVAHFKSRRIETTRWEPLNVAALCKGCHFTWGHHHPDEFRDWWLARIGEAGMARLNALWKRPKAPELDTVRAYILALTLGVR